MSDLRYPIGKFEFLQDYTTEYIEESIKAIGKLPARLAAAVDGLNEDQLNTPYRPSGWTVKQVVHHVSESHLNSVVRFKWTLTEETPLIKTYLEKGWAETPEIEHTPTELSLEFIEILHKKWVILLESLSPADWAKTFVHPELNKEIALGSFVGLYAWHGKHHTAHITSLRDRENW